MREPLYISGYYESAKRLAKRSAHLGVDVNWAGRVPVQWRKLTIGPLWIEVHRDKDSHAERWVGYDEEDSPCLCRYYFQWMAGATDKHGGHEEDLMAWRMRDGRWLIHRIIMRHATGETSYAFYAFSESMPR
jgi:hypothetical protein